MLTAETQLCPHQFVRVSSFSSLGANRLDLAGELVALLITSIHLAREEEQNIRMPIASPTAYKIGLNSYVLAWRSCPECNTIKFYSTLLSEDLQTLSDIQVEICCEVSNTNCFTEDGENGAKGELNQLVQPHTVCITSLY